eukprot:12354815-Alexandrium_andersonii.AAC.1
MSNEPPGELAFGLEGAGTGLAIRASPLPATSRLNASPPGGSLSYERPVSSGVRRLDDLLNRRS